MRSVIRIMRHSVYQWEGGGATPPDPPQHGVEIVDITLDNVEQVLQIREPRQLAIFKKYLNERRLGVFAMRDGHVLGHAWINTPGDRTLTLNSYFRLLPGEALIHYCHVDTAARGQGLYGAMLRDLAIRLTAEGRVKRILIDTDRGNAPSIRGIEKEQFRFVSATWYILAGRWLLFRWQRL